MKQLRVMVSILALGCAAALGGAGLAGLASAQGKPESLLPPGFDDPAPAPSPASTPPVRQGTAPSPQQGNVPPPAVQAGILPPANSGNAARSLPPLPAITRSELARLPSLDELENMSTEELDQLLGLKPKTDIPPGARRALTRIGVLAVDEGGLPPMALANQSDDLVRAVLAGTRGPLVSRWGHIVLRRALVSRMAAPLGMEPAEFAALRLGVLNAMGEYALTRAVAQDIDSADWSPSLTQHALDAYLASGDITGACPAVRLQGSGRDDGQWKMWQAICNAYAGETALAASQLDRALFRGAAPRIDVLLARRFAGAAGRSQRGVQIEWQGVDDLNPWRFGLASAVGEPLPEGLLDNAMQAEGGAYYARAGALLPMLPASQRAAFAGQAAREGIMSADAMVDLYSEIHTDAAASGDPQSHAATLREAYLASSPAARIAAMERLWAGDTVLGGLDGYGAKVLTAYAAARIPADAAHTGKADMLIASMLAAGLDANAVRWADVVEEGSLGWALIALADPRGSTVGVSAVDGFADNDSSTGARKTAFLAAGLAGLGRLNEDDARSVADDLGFDLARQTRWTNAISRAASVGNPALVVLLAGLGMQGESWQQMTPRHLYHITAALNRVGMQAEARMIAAEALARG
ncbi:hypothetical protein [Erythrobacter sp. R86502]|uniref:hypothetical protein n=1 Tax=Erythrobacter sp. R86502 TaxID=3093846 RepID=UPI0036D24C46